MSEQPPQQASSTTVTVVEAQPNIDENQGDGHEPVDVNMETMDGRETFQLFGSDMGNFSKAAEAAQNHMREHWREWARQNNFSVSYDATPPPKEPPPPPPPPPRDEPDVFMGPRKRGNAPSAGKVELSETPMLQASKPPPSAANAPPAGPSLALPPALMMDHRRNPSSSRKKKKQFALSATPIIQDLPFVDAVPSRDRLLQTDEVSMDAFAEEFQQRFS